MDFHFGLVLGLDQQHPVGEESQEGVDGEDKEENNAEESVRSGAALSSVEALSAAIKVRQAHEEALGLKEVYSFLPTSVLFDATNA